MLLSRYHSLIGFVNWDSVILTPKRLSETVSENVFSTYKLNNSGDRIHPWRTSFLTSKSSDAVYLNFCFLVSIQITNQSHILSIQSQISKVRYQEILLNVVKCLLIINEAHEGIFSLIFDFGRADQCLETEYSFSSFKSALNIGCLRLLPHIFYKVLCLKLQKF